MATKILPLCPTETSYAAKHNTSGYLRVELEGGQGRYRKDILNPAMTVSCRWVVGGEHFNYLWAFYRLYLHTMEPFYIDLVLEEGESVRVLANIIPGSFEFGAKQGPTYTVTAQLEVQPPYYDPADDEELIYIVDAFGPDYKQWLERLWVTVNIDYPETMRVPPLYL